MNPLIIDPKTRGKYSVFFDILCGYLKKTINMARIRFLAMMICFCVRCVLPALEGWRWFLAYDYVRKGRSLATVPCIYHLLRWSHCDL